MSEVAQFPVTSTLGLLWVLPFVGLLLSIALVAMIAPPHWASHYGKWTAGWALAFVAAAAVVRGVAPMTALLTHTALHEYLPFILLLGALYTVTGGIHIAGTPRPSAAINTALLAVGVLLAGVIGTLAASLLLVRPLLRINRNRRRRAHLLVFFIVLVANVGGALSPAGNPPLLLGYLEGVPFLWPLRLLWLPTGILSLGLLASFFAIDRLLLRREGDLVRDIETLGVRGMVNVPLLAGIIATVVLAPALIADGLYIVFAALSLWLTPRAARRANEFEWEPIVEVAILFAGIFVTLIPAIGAIAAGPHGPAAPLFSALATDGAPNNLMYYAATGFLSAFLDNTPTYLVFFDFAGGDAARLTGPLATTLAAISAGACYFGALSYLGNAPNLVVKSLAERHGVIMPNFFSFVGVAVLIAGPWYALIALLFFR